MAAKRFVILRHECPEGYKPGVHWDLMLEEADSLRTWALAVEPAIGLTIAAEQLSDHRLAYLDYEGPISGNRGRVSRWDSGRYELLDSSAAELCFLLLGHQIRGRGALTRDPKSTASWSLTLSPTLS